MSGVEFITDLRTDIAKRAYDEVMFAATPREAKKIQESQSAILDTGIRGYDSRKGPRYDSIVRNVEQYNADQGYQPHIFASETDKEVFECIGGERMSGLPKRVPQEARLLDPGIVDIATQRQVMAQAIGQQIIDGLAALPEQQTIQPATWRDVLARGGADGLNGADGSGNDPEMMQDYLDRINGEGQ